MRLGLVALAFIPTYIGQKQINVHPKTTAFLFALGFFMVLVSSIWRRERLPIPCLPPPDKHLKSRAWWLIPSVIFALLNYFAVLSQKFLPSTELDLWLFSLGFLILPFWIRRRQNADSKDEGRSEDVSPRPLSKMFSIITLPRKGEIAVFLFLLALALAFRLPFLERYPVVIHNDEGSHGMIGQQIINKWNNEGVDWFSLCSFYDFPTLGFTPSALMQALFSRNLFAHRFADVLLGMATLIFQYLLIRGLLGPPAALLNLAFSAVGHFAVHWSRTGEYLQHIPFLTSLCGWLLWKAITTGKARWFILTGISLSLTLFTSNAAVAIPVWLILVVILFFIFSRRIFKRYIVSTLLSFLASVIFFAPMLGIYTKNSDKFLVRRNSMMFSAHPNSVQHMKHSFGENYLPKIFLHNLKQAVLVFNRSSDTGQHYGYTCGGILDDIAASAFILGLAVAIPRLGYFAYWPIFLGLFLNWFLGGVLCMNAVSYTSIAGMACLVYFVPMLWGRELLETAQEAFGRFGVILAGGFLTIGLIIVSVMNFRLYFVCHDVRHGNLGEVKRSCIALDARDDGQENITFVPEEVFPTNFQHEAHRFIAGSQQVQAVEELSEIQIPLDRGFKTATFLIPLNDESSLQRLREHFPQGKLEARKLLFRNPSHIYDRYIVPLEYVSKEVSVNVIH